MVTVDEAQEMLEEIAEELPAVFFKELNGGILLLPEAKVSPQAVANDLYILGEYHRHYSMGRLIYMYFGSFERLFGHLEGEAFKQRLRETLFHEFTHHIESLAGEKGLELEDARRLAAYKREKGL